MKDAIGMFVGWSYPLVAVVLIVMAATLKGLRGRAWLISHLGLNLVVMLVWRLPQLLLKLNIIKDVSVFYSQCGISLNVLGLIAYCLLIPFVLVSSNNTDVGQQQSEGNNSMTGLFSMTGRYNRARYFWTVFVMSLVLYVLCFVLGLAIGSAGGNPAIAAGLSLFITIPGSVIIAFQVVKRLHDLDRPGSHYWLLWIPFYNIYLGLVILFNKGTAGMNKYGPDPLAGK